jgi:hypothetical protein
MRLSASKEMHRNRTLAKKSIRLTLKEVRAIEKRYCAKEKRFAKLSKVLGRGTDLRLQKECDKLSMELNGLSVDIEDWWLQLREDSGWRARLILIW